MRKERGTKWSRGSKVLYKISPRKRDAILLVRVQGVGP